MSGKMTDDEPAETGTVGGMHAQRDLTRIETEHLEAEIASQYARLSAETCRWLELVAELDRREAYKRWGCRTCAAWLSWHCGIAIRSGQEQVKVARRLAEMPLVAERFRRGELTYSKVRALARIVEPDSEESLLDFACNATAAQLERTVSAYRRAATATPEDSLAERRFCDIHVEDDGCVSVRARLAPEEGALLKLAIERAQEELYRERDDDCVRSETSREPIPVRSPRSGRADALVRTAESALAAGGASRTGGDSTQVVVHVEPATIAGTSEGVRSEIEDTTGIAPETARRLACDASLVVMHERDGVPLSVGRKTRSIPPAIRRALRSRDQGVCAFPGCEARRFTDAHHIQHWAHGGATDLENLVTLCRHHHRLVHEGGFTVSRAEQDGTLRFTRPDGTTIPPSPQLPAPSSPSERAHRHSAPDWVDPRGMLGPMSECGPRHGHQRLDLDLALLCLLSRRRPRGSPGT